MTGRQEGLLIPPPRAGRRAPPVFVFRPAGESRAKYELLRLEKRRIGYIVGRCVGGGECQVGRAGGGPLPAAPSPGGPHNRHWRRHYLVCELSDMRFWRMFFYGE